MVISFVSLKGGSGKTTLSTNLAVSYAIKGASICLIDADPNNQNTLKWSGIRPEEKRSITTVALPDPDALRKNIKDLELKHDIVIIDGTPALAKLTGTIMLLSDLVILPIRSSTWDIWAFNDQFLPKLEEIRALRPDVNCWIVRNCYNARKIITREALEVIEQYDIPIMRSKIGDRTVFEFAPSRGLGVVECDDELASWEIDYLRNEVSEILSSLNVEY